MLVRDIMTASVITFFAEQTLPLAEDVMKARHMRHIPVIDDDGLLVGLVSHRDLLAAQISSLVGLGEAERRARQADTPVRSIMTTDVWTVTPETPARIAAQTLLDHRFGCLPVVDAAHKLVGIITERDFLRLALKHLST